MVTKECQPLLVLIVEEGGKVRVVSQPDPRVAFCRHYLDINPQAIALPVEARDLISEGKLPGGVDLGRV